MIIYLMNHCPDTYESASYTVSIHRTKEGAERAMLQHRQQEEEEWEHLYRNETDEEYKSEFPWNYCKSWNISEQELED